MLSVEIAIGSPSFQLFSDFFTFVISFLFVEIFQSEHHLTTFFPGVILILRHEIGRSGGRAFEELLPPVVQHASKPAECRFEASERRD